MREKGTVYFFTGLAGAGKTTIGGLFYERLRERSPDAVLLDGDTRRKSAIESEATSTQDKICARSYTTEARREGAKKLFENCRDLAEQGRDVVCCSISMYRDVREWNRANIDCYVEVYVKASWETLFRRNQKGLYTSGQKNVVGIDLPWDEPECPDIVVENDGFLSPEEQVEKISGILFGG